MECTNLEKNGLQPIQSVGSGGYGEVFLVETAEKDIVAVKTILDPKNVMYMEYAAQANISSPYVMPIQRVTLPNTLAIVMDYAPFALRSIINVKYTFNERISVLRKILEGVKCIHQNGILHCDLKPSNIQLRFAEREGATILEPVIIDFGLAIPVVSVLSGRNMHRMRGTPSYLPPEILERGAAYIYTEKVDVWAVGLIALILLTNRSIYPHNFVHSGAAALHAHLTKHIKGGSFREYIRGIIQRQKNVNIQQKDVKDVLQFLTSALMPDPSKRSSIQTLLAMPLFSRMQTPLEPCSTNVLEWPPVKKASAKALKMMSIAIRVIVRSFRDFSFKQGGAEYDLSAVNVMVFFWAMDLMYMYFTHPSVNVDRMAVNRCVSYAITFVVMALQMDDFTVDEMYVDEFIDLHKDMATGTQPITYDLVKSLEPEIAVTLNGLLWRRFMYESIRTQHEYSTCFKILYNPSRYLEYVPATPIDPINEAGPVFMQKYNVTNIPSID